MGGDGDDERGGGGKKGKGFVNVMGTLPDDDEDEDGDDTGTEGDGAFVIKEGERKEGVCDGQTGIDDKSDGQ